MRKLTRIAAGFLAIALTGATLTGCGSGGGKDTQSANSGTSGETSSNSSGTSGEQVVLNYWTWFPSEDQAKEAIDAFEKENPDIKINMTVMESKTFQEKVPLALTTNEDIDVIGVQPSAFAEEIQDYLADLEPLMETAVGSDWKSNYSENALNQANQLTGDATKMLVLTNSGSVIGFYNVDLLNEIECEVPTTLEEYKAVADELYKVYPDKYAGVFAGKEAWVMDEMMLTVLGQQGDTYNQWRYNGQSVDCQEYIDAMNGFKKFFDEGIFSPNVLDLDYASATEEFTNGDALVYYMGSWEAPLLSSSLRESNGIKLGNVSAMALPVVEKGGTPTVRAYLDSCIGVVNYSSKQEAAAKFVAYMTLGEGADIFGKQLSGTSGKLDFAVDESLFSTPEEKEGWDTVVDLLANATADRNNVSGYSDIEGASVQSVINGTSTAEEEAKSLQAEWTSGKY